MSKGKKWLFGALAGVLVLGTIAAVYVLIWSSKHKVEYGSKHKISKKEKSQLSRFTSRLKKCSKEVFTHKDIGSTPPKGAAESGYKKAIAVVLTKVKGCLTGTKAADGMGYSGKMPPKILAGWVAAKDCKEFADRLVKGAGCSPAIDALPDEAGFKDDLGLD